MLDCYRIDFSAYCAAFPTGEWKRLLAQCNCNMCGPKMARSVTEGQSHDEGRGGRGVTGVQWGHKTKVYLGAWKCNEWAEKLKSGSMATLFATMYYVAFKHGFAVTRVYSWPLVVNYKI